MKAFTVLSALVGLLPIVSAWSKWDGGNCLSDADAQYIVDQSIIVITHPDLDAARAAGLALYVPDVVVNGDSINVLNDVPVCYSLSATFSSFPKS